MISPRRLTETVMQVCCSVLVSVIIIGYIILSQVPGGRVVSTIRSVFLLIFFESLVNKFFKKVKGYFFFSSISNDMLIIITLEFFISSKFVDI